MTSCHVFSRNTPKGIIQVPGNWVSDSLKGVVQFPGYPGIGSSSNYFAWRPFLREIKRGDLLGNISLFLRTSYYMIEEESSLST